MKGSSMDASGCTSRVATPQPCAPPGLRLPPFVVAAPALVDTEALVAASYCPASSCNPAQRFFSTSITPADLAPSAKASPRSPGRRISFTPGAFFAFLTRSVTTAARFSNSPWPSSAGSMAMTRLPQFFSDILSATAAPTRGPARSSTMSARLLDLYPPSNVLMAPPSMAALGSSVMFPLPSMATPWGIFFPAVRASRSPKKEYAEVAMSSTTGPLAVGMPTPMGFVPKTGSMAPLGATNSGLTANTSEMRPRLARFSA